MHLFRDFTAQHATITTRAENLPDGVLTQSSNDAMQPHIFGHLHLDAPLLAMPEEDEALELVPLHGSEIASIARLGFDGGNAEPFRLITHRRVGIFGAGLGMDEGDEAHVVPLI